MDDLHKTRYRMLADFLLRWRLLLLVGSSVLTILLYGPASRLDFDQSIESLYAPDDSHLLAYLKSKSTFGGDEFVMVAWSEPDVLSNEGMERVRVFSDELSNVSGVQKESTQDIAKSLAPQNRPFVLNAILRRSADKMRKLSERMLVGTDGETTAVILRLLPEHLAKVSRAETFAEIRAMAAAHDSPAYVVGEPVQVLDMFRYVEEDSRLLFQVSLGLLAAVILFLFRRIRWVVLPLAVVVATIIWTKSFLVFGQLQLSMVSSMLNSLVTIVGIATVVHVTLHYRDMRQSLDRVDSLRQTIVELGPAVFWTCSTTAVGFGALLSSDITPVHSLGLMMGMASLTVLIASAGVLPGGILIGRRSADPGFAPSETALAKLLERITDWVLRRPFVLSVAAMATAIVALAGFFKLHVETDFSKNFRESSPIVSSLNFVETNLGGAGTWEVNVPAPTVLTPEYLDGVRSLAGKLRAIERNGSRQLTKVVAITDVLDLVPGLANSPERIRGKLDKINQFQPEYEPSLYNADSNRIRFMLRALERQPSEDKLALIEEVERTAAEQFDEAKATGLFVLLTFLIESLLRDQLVSFALAAVGIGTMMTIAFGSPRIGLISLVPNLFPVIVVVGAMGWLGLPINIGTAMIASVSMGLTVDASIHYISGYRRALARGLGPEDALRQTHKSVGRALVFATLSLIVGFSVLTLSHFIPLVYFGVLVSLAMLGGLIGNLTLLPLLLRWADR